MNFTRFRVLWLGGPWLRPIGFHAFAVCHRLSFNLGPLGFRWER